MTESIPKAAPLTMLPIIEATLSLKQTNKTTLPEIHASQTRKMHPIRVIEILVRNIHNIDNFRYVVFITK